MIPTKRELNSICLKLFKGEKKGFISFLDFKNSKFVCKTYAYRFDSKLNKYETMIAIKRVENSKHINVSARLYYTGISGYNFYMNSKQKISYYRYLYVDSLENGKPYMQKYQTLTWNVPATLYNPEELLKDSSFKYIPKKLVRDAFSIYNNPITAINRLRVDPYRSEMILKYGCANMLRDQRFYRLDKAKLRKMVLYLNKIDENRRSKCSAYNCITWNIKHKISPETAFDLSQIKELSTFKSIGFNDFSSQRELQKYLIKQHSNFRIYSDYIQLRTNFGLSNESHSAKFPSNLAVAHDRLVDKSLEIENKEIDKDLSSSYKKVVDLFSKNNIKEYELFVPKNSKDFRTIGNELGNCVGSLNYNERMSKKEDVIIALRKDSELYCCIEIAPNKAYNPQLIQCYLKCNAEPDSELERLVKNRIVPHFKGYFRKEQPAT